MKGTTGSESGGEEEQHECTTHVDPEQGVERVEICRSPPETLAQVQLSLEMQSMECSMREASLWLRCVTARQAEERRLSV